RGKGQPRMRYRIFPLLAVGCLLGLGIPAATAPAQAPAPPPPPAPALTAPEVFPPHVSLATAPRRQAVAVKATYADGPTRAAPAEAKAALANPALARLEKNVLAPLADGATEMKVEFGGKAVVVPVKVTAAAADRPVSFKLDVMPVFMKAGCNQ